MSEQASDIFWYNDKKFYLIDCEKGKSLIASADFNLYCDISSSGCWRGYTAEYRLLGKTLFGVKSVRKYIYADFSDPFKDPFEDPDIEDFKVTSNEKLMKYTGSVVIAANNRKKKWHENTDFLSCYLNFDKAYELYFVDGELTEVRDLYRAIIDWRLIEAYNAVFERKESLYRKYYIDGFAKKYLKYEYEFNSYKWREHY